MDSNPYESPENIDSSAIGSPTPNGRGLGYIAAVCFVTTIGGFLFGYDTAVISGGIDFIERQFALSPDMKGWVVASALLGCIVGSACSGAMADRFGRKSVLLLSSALLLISAVGSMLPQSAVQLVVARMIGGLGIGITATASPMYMSEVSPAHFRGRMVSLYQLAITLGIVAAFTVNAVLLQYAAARSGAAGSGFWHWIAVAEVWRAMFGAGAIPAALYVLLLGFIPESPRWLIGQGRVAEARSVMRHTMTEAEMERAVADVSDALSHESNSVFELFQPGLRRALVLGVLLALFSQFSGINAVMYFGPTILKNVGFAAGRGHGRSHPGGHHQLHLHPGGHLEGRFLRPSAALAGGRQRGVRLAGGGGGAVRHARGGQRLEAGAPLVLLRVLLVLLRSGLLGGDRRDLPHPLSGEGRFRRDGGHLARGLRRLATLSPDAPAPAGVGRVRRLRRADRGGRRVHLEGPAGDQGPHARRDRAELDGRSGVSASSRHGVPCHTRAELDGNSGLTAFCLSHFGGLLP